MSTVLILEVSGTVTFMFSNDGNAITLHDEDLSGSGYVEFILQRICVTSSKFKIFLLFKSCSFFFFFKLSVECVMHSLIWFVHRSTPVQDVILGLLRNCSNRGGVFYYNIAVILWLSYLFAQKRKKNCVFLLFSADNGSMPTISSGPQNQQSFEVFFLTQLSPSQKCNKCHNFP